MTAPDPPAPPDRHARLAAAHLYVISSLGPDDDADLELAALRAAVAGGAAMVQLRCKGASTQARRAWAARCRDALGPQPLLIMNDDLDAVRDAQGRPLVDGVHLGRRDAEAHAPGVDIAAGLAAARAHLGPGLLLGTSTRDANEIAAAVAAGADHVGFGAMAPSVTKPDTTPADRHELARCITAFPDLPVFPIGGLSPDNLAAIAAAGARRAAVGAAVLSAADPQDAARRCLALLAGD